MGGVLFGHNVLWGKDSFVGLNSVPVVILCFHVLLNCFGRVLGDIGRINALISIQMIYWNSNWMFSSRANPKWGPLKLIHQGDFKKWSIRRETLVWEPVRNEKKEKCLPKQRHATTCMVWFCIWLAYKYNIPWLVWTCCMSLFEPGLELRYTADSSSSTCAIHAFQWFICNHKPFCEVKGQILFDFPLSQLQVQRVKMKRICLCCQTLLS